MTKHPASSRHALAADLLADLAKPPPTDTASSVTARRTGPVKDAAARRTARSPAVQWLVRFSPLEWRLPHLSIARDATALRIGPIRLEVTLLDTAVG